jgi:anaerobic ribonucleoside-triphosphate reductase
VAKCYILYRKQREKIRNMKSTILDYKELVNNYVHMNDWRVKENSTVTYSVGGLILSNSGAITANYWLAEIYDEEIANAHRSADLHLHDLSMLTGYCAGWSLKQLIQEGLGGVPGKITSAPASHLATLCNQMVNFLGIMQNEWAGAQAFSSFDTYLAPFVKADSLNYDQTKKCIESFIYGVNTPSRWGTQAPFSNITLDWTVPDDLRELPAIIGGKEMDFTYGDCRKEMDMVNKAFIEIMIEGDANGRGFQYPIPTYSITRDFDWSDTENNRLLFEMTAKYGTPYFSNYVNSDMQPSDVRSMCCRLRLDLRELRKKTGGFFGSGESTGSVGVVTINMPRIAYLSANKSEFYTRLDHMMDIAARSLKIKRGVITKLLDEGLYPYTKRYLGTFENHFSTIGLIGMNEVGLNANWLRADLTHKETQEFTKEVLVHMRDRLKDYQEQYGDLYNLEATPAESTTYRLAKHDRAKWPNIKTAGLPGETPYYTNSSHLPVGYSSDVFDALDVQDELQTLYTSGTVFHAFLGEKLPDWKAAANIVKTIADNYRLPYYTLSPTYSVCAEHGYIAGEVYECPQCKKKTEVYSRITGYYRPVQNWNDGKLQEFKDRQLYDLKKSVLKKPTSTVVKVSNLDSDTPQVETGVPQNIRYLFTTKTCPNCKMAKEFLREKNISFITIDAEEDTELTNRYGIMQAPTLVIVNGDSSEKIVNASNIRKYAEDLAAVPAVPVR